MDKKTKDPAFITWVMLGAIFLIAFIIRWYLMCVSDNYHAIAIGKILLALNVLKGSPFLSHFNPAHGPLHPYLIALLLKFWNDPLHAPVIISVLAGAFFVFPYYGYVKACFNERVALFSAFVATCYTQHLVYSVLSSAEITFNFLLFSSFFFFIVARNRQKKQNIYLMLSGLLFGLACMERFDSLVLFPVMIVFSFIYFGIRKSLFFNIAAFIFPVFWFIINFLRWGNPFEFLTGSDNVVQREYLYYALSGDGFSTFQRLGGWGEFLLKTLKPYFAIVCFSGLVIAAVKKKHLHILISFLSIFLVFTFKTFRQELLLDYRYGVFLALLCIPFGVMTLDSLFRNLVSAKNVNAMLFSSTVMINVIFLMTAIPQLKYVPPGMNDVGNYFQHNLKAEDKVLIVLGDLDALYYLPLYTGHNEDNFESIRHVGGSFSIFDQSNIYRWMAYTMPRYVLAKDVTELFPEGDDERYDIGPSTSIVLSKVFSASTYNGKAYTIYEITYSGILR